MCEITDISRKMYVNLFSNISLSVLRKTMKSKENVLSSLTTEDAPKSLRSVLILTIRYNYAT